MFNNYNDGQKWIILLNQPDGFPCQAMVLLNFHPITQTDQIKCFLFFPPPYLSQMSRSTKLFIKQLNKILNTGTAIQYSDHMYEKA